MVHQVLLFYKYVTISDPEALRAELQRLCDKHNLLGRVLVASEGINATVEGLTEDTEAFVLAFLKIPQFSDISIKRSEGNGKAFPKLSVKVRDQIVGTRFTKEESDPEKKTATHVSPEELRAWFQNEEEFVVLDMRNEYEYDSGHFKNSIHPGLNNSRDLPMVLPKLENIKKKKVVTVCTGGVRCEPMSAYLLGKGFTDIYQLDGGIHAYMQKFPGKDFKGTLYTFDQRTTMHFGGEREIVGTCMKCKGKTEEYVDCANLLCHLQFMVCGECKTGQVTYCNAECSEIVKRTLLQAV